MNYMCRTLQITVIIIFVSAGLLHPLSEGVKVGVVQEVDAKSGVITVSSPSAGTDIKMGDLLYVRIDGKVVQIRSTFPMMTVSKCKAEGNNRELWPKVEKGTIVYRYMKGVENSHNKVYIIGDRGPAGGVIFYDKGNSDGGWRYLEAAPEDQSKGIPWYNVMEIEVGSTEAEIGSGRLNTKTIIKAQGKGKYAAKLCADFRGGGKRDWFLPSKDELNLMYVNLHTIGVGGFADYYYWSSSEAGANYVWYQNFYDGGQTNGFNMNSTLYVRAVRAFTE